MAELRKHSTTSNVERFILTSSATGKGLTGLSSASTGLIISTIAGNESTATTYTVAASNVETITTLGTYAAPTASKCRFKEVDATNHPGLYEFQFADARYSVASAKKLIVTVSGATNLIDAYYEIALVSFDPFNAASLGLSNLNSTISGVPAAVWDEVLTPGTHNVNFSAGRRLRNAQEFGGYEGGFVWINTGSANAGTQDYEDGTVHQPVNSLANAITVATSIALNKFHIRSGNSITLSQSFTNYVMFGHEWNLALNGKDIAGTHIAEAHVTGIATSSGNRPHFEHCDIGTCTLPASYIHDGLIEGTITLGTGLTTIDNCSTGEAAAVLDYGAAIGNTTVLLSDYSGDIEVQNMGQLGTDVLYFIGGGRLTVNANCTGGTIYVGANVVVTNNGAATVTPLTSRLVDEIWDEVLTGATHNVPASSGRRLRTIGDALSATVNDAAATTSSFITTLTSAVNNFYVDQTLYFDSGSLAGSSRIITGYVGATKTVTFDEPWTSAPANGDAFTIDQTHVHAETRIADALLSRNVSGGSSTGRTVKQALHFLRNKWSISGGTLTVCDTDDATTSWTAATAQTAGDPVSSVDPT